MNVRASRDAGNRGAECGKWNAVLSQKLYERLALRLIRSQLNVHRVAMIQSPLIMDRALAEHRNWQWMLERLLKESFDRRRLAQQPMTSPGITNERPGGNKRAAPHRAELGHLFLSFNLDQRLRNLRIRAADLLLRRRNF